MLEKLKSHYRQVCRIGVGAAVRKAVLEIRRRGMVPAHLKGLPSTVQIEISNLCNMRCTYCVLKESRLDENLMSPETFRLLSPHFIYFRSISLSGLAEPFLNENVVDFIVQIKESAPYCEVNLVTNGTFLTEDVCRSLVDAGLDSLGFSLDGTDPYLVDEIRKGGSLQGAISGIMTLNSIKRQMRRFNPVIYATTVLQRKNLGQLDGVIRLAADLGVSRLDVNGLEPYSHDVLGAELWSAPIDTEVTAAFEKAATSAKSMDVEVRVVSLKPQKPSCCDVMRPVVMSNGDVVPCAALAYSRPHFFVVDGSEIHSQEGKNQRRSFGNIKETPFADIWFSHDYRGFREKVLRGDYSDECRSCLIKHGIICVRGTRCLDDAMREIKAEV